MFRRKTDIETCLQCHDRKEFTRKDVHGALDNGCDTCHDLHQNNYSDLGEPILNELCSDCHEEGETHAHPIGAEYKDPRTGRPLTCASCHEPHSSDHEYMLTFDHQRDLCVQCHTAGTMRVR
jgi:predicted CXXCH cytochrome family protein